MNQAETLLLRLLSSSLWGTSNEPVTLADLQEVMSLAKAHTVDGQIAGLVSDNRIEIEECPEKEDAIMEIMGIAVKHERMYKKHCHAVEELDHLMTESGIPYIIFKGTAVAVAYHRPGLRTMGDIDFYVPHTHFDLAKKIIGEEWNVKIEHGDSEKHLGFEYKGTPFEMHHRIETFGTSKHQRVFDAMVDNAVKKAVIYNVDDGYARKLPAEEDLIVVFKHMFNHLLLEGVGLRQVVDVAVLMNAYKSSIEKSSIRNHLKELGYLRAFDATTAMLDEYLHIPCASQYAPLSERDYRWGKFLMRYVLESGNFGRKAYKYLVPGIKRSSETAKHEIKHCFKLAPLLPTDMPMFILRRLGITFRKNFIKHN